MPETTYTVRYQYATYRGTKTVVASDDEQAIALVREQCRQETGLTMAYEHYEVVHVQ